MYFLLYSCDNQSHPELAVIYYTIDVKDFKNKNVWKMWSLQDICNIYHIEYANDYAI